MSHPSAPSYNQYDDFYSKPTPPPLPDHIETNRDTTDQHALNEVPVNSPSPYPVYNQHQSSPLVSSAAQPVHNFNDHQQAQRDSMSDMKFLDHYDSDDDLEKIIPREKKKRSCIDKLCCGCCTCCPKWARWCSCILLIIFVIIAIIVGVFAALFKVPVVKFTGLKQDPVVTNMNNVLTMEFQVGISVDNPNFAGLTFETIKADAYYPAPYNVYIGGGNVTDVVIAAKGLTDIDFPFTVHVNSSDPGEQGVLMDLVTRCGFDGSVPEQMTFDYYVYPTVRVAGIAITPQISKTMSVPCPLTAPDLTSIFTG